MALHCHKLYTADSHQAAMTLVRHFYTNKPHCICYTYFLFIIFFSTSLVVLMQKAYLVFQQILKF